MLRGIVYALQYWLEPIWLGGSLRIARAMANSKTAPPNDPTRVLIHIANYNGKTWVGEAIASVLNQTHENWGLLVIDDFSTDDSTDLIQKFAFQDDRIRLVLNEQNLGTARTHNLAIERFRDETKWDAFCILDCDDVASPDWLSTGVYAIRSGALGLRPILSRYDEKLERHQWDYIGCNQTFWAREVIEDLGWYRLKPHMYDHDFMERAKKYAFLRGKCILQSKRSLQKMRMRGDNQSLKKKGAAEIEAERLSINWARNTEVKEALFVGQNGQAPV